MTTVDTVYLAAAVMGAVIALYIIAYRHAKDKRDLREALETLHDFREFWSDNVTQTKLGASHHNPMWGRVANLLDKHGMNNGPGNAEAYYKFDPAYRNNN